jgi:isocitrate/isopropylmalate dehydrogenase
MIFSAATMLDWRRERHNHATAGEAAQRIETNVDRAFAGTLRPCELSGSDGTAAIFKAVLRAPEREIPGD